MLHLLKNAEQLQVICQFVYFSKKKCNNSEISEVLVIGRNPIDFTHPKLKELIHKDFTNFAEVKNQLTAV